MLGSGWGMSTTPNCSNPVELHLVIASVSFHVLLARGWIAQGDKVLCVEGTWEMSISSWSFEEEIRAQRG